MSFRGEPQTIPEHIAYIYELLRRLHVPSDAVVAPVEVVVPDEDIFPQTLLFTRGGTLAAETCTPPFFPTFSGIISTVRANVGTAPSGTAAGFDVYLNGVSIFPSSTKPSVPVAALFGLARVPDTRPFAADDKLEVVIDTPASAADLVLAIDFVRDV